MPDMHIRLDDLDYAAVQRALAVRQRWRAMPDHDSSVAGSVLAEICRGWLEMIGEDPTDYIGEYLNAGPDDDHTN